MTTERGPGYGRRDILIARPSEAVAEQDLRARAHSDAVEGPVTLVDNIANSTLLARVLHLVAHALGLRARGRGGNSARHPDGTVPPSQHFVLRSQPR
jgi:hypothetical protein